MNLSSPSRRGEDFDLLELTNRTGYRIIQENGQRKYGGPPPNWSGPPPPKGSEVFIGNIPRDLAEDSLVPIFEKVGYIYEMRLMMDFSGTNRGFGFVMFSNPPEATRAIIELNYYPIRPNHYLRVNRSVDNCRLFVGGIPKDIRREEILNEMKKVTEGVVNVIVHPLVSDKTKSRGFAFVEYENHRAAALARRKLLPQKIPLFGKVVGVDWAEPEPEMDEEIMSRVTNLYVRGLHLNTSEDLIRRYFERISTGIQRVKKQGDFCFVDYERREQAENVIKQLTGCSPVIDGAHVEITWAKPVDKTSYNTHKELVKTISHGGLLSPLQEMNPMDSSQISPGSSYSSVSSRTVMRPGRGAGGMLSTRAAQAAVQRSRSIHRALEELRQICFEMNWDGPHFKLFTTQDPRATTIEAQTNCQFVYGVTIGSQSYCSSNLWMDKEQAWEDAIVYALWKIRPYRYLGCSAVTHPPTPLINPRDQPFPPFYQPSFPKTACAHPNYTPLANPVPDLTSQLCPWQPLTTHSMKLLTHTDRPSQVVPPSQDPAVPSMATGVFRTATEGGASQGELS